MKGYSTYPLLVVCILFSSITLLSQSIPLPEHPRPDFERLDWQNLNGMWDFAFDPENEGGMKNWAYDGIPTSTQIQVPFPWGSPLSGVEDKADVGWYSREVTIDPTWEGKRVFLIIGAADWETEVWWDGTWIGMHRGGYVPIEMELTEEVSFGESQTLTIRVDDKRRDFTLYGKQGYGNARGIWQTVYVEARGQSYLDALHVAPNIDESQASFTAYLPYEAEEDYELSINITGIGQELSHQVTFPKGNRKIKFDVSIPNALLWDLENPHLYQVEAQLEEDLVKTYFGMRKISVVDLPGTAYPYIALNDKPIYLQLALDQSYHPEGFYTFPSDQFMKEEIERSKSIGLNGIRVHIKVEVPRKLYWADKLGLLVMEDLPNSWGEPGLRMRSESEYTLKQMIKRDFNHPSIFSWVDFNETWGLWTKSQKEGKEVRAYLPETQSWVASMYYLTKSLDPTRLVEDNSICCGRGHTETDINSWHVYLPGWAWEEYLSEIVENTYEGSPHHFESGFTQGRQPNINSECGNVWGYEGSTGDVDWSWDYHRMVNTFRKHPKIGGWLYTEHHDVINEWNGYWRFDRSEKETGFGGIFEGMRLNDLHAPVYLSTGNEICRSVEGGSSQEVPLYLSVMTDTPMEGKMKIHYSLEHMNSIGETRKITENVFEQAYQPWMQVTLDPLSLTMAEGQGISTLKLWVSNAKGQVLQRNFFHFVVESGSENPSYIQLSIAPGSFSAAKWSKKQWEVMEGKKVNGAGEGYFEYELPISPELSLKGVKSAYFLAEVSAKQLFVKDQQAFDRNQDYMKGSRVSPSSNPNSYPMTDETRFPSELVISIEGEKVQTTTLGNDPADHRGILSWHNQLKDKKLREAGSYGYMVKVPISKKMLRTAVERGKLRVKLEAAGEGGIALYGKDFGRFPFDPSLVLRYDK
ncbi:MAG: sugar-binding domain-containing protein [Bacteroidota bacterium]